MILNILHVITTISRGGAENHLCDLVRHQIEVGYRVGIAWLKGTDYWKDRLERMGADMFDLNIRRYADPRGVMRLRSILRNQEVGLVHAHLPPAELYARFAVLGRPEVRFVISKHNDTAFSPFPASDAVGRWVARRADAVVCISAAVGRSVAAHRLGIDRKNVKIIHYGIDPTPYYDVSLLKSMAVREAWQCASSTVVYGCVARMVSQKNHVLLLTAFAEMRRRTKSDCKLVLIGDGPMRAELRELAHRLGPEAGIVFAGFCEDMPPVMCALDVLCLTSRYEGFGLVLIEAMAAAKPIVATNVSSIPEIVTDGETGCLVRENDVGALGSALEKMLWAPLRRSMGEAGRRSVARRFTLERMFRQTDEVYAAIGWPIPRRT